MKTEETAGIGRRKGGIAEALVTTAFGLFVAVPAFGFQHLHKQNRNVHSRDGQLVSELIDYFLKRRSETRG